MKKQNAFVKSLLACAVVGWLCAGFGLDAGAQSAPANPLPPELQPVVSLSQQHMSDEVITSYIRNSGKTFKLSATDILYLSNQGVSQPVISALLQTGGPAASTPPTAFPVPSADTSADTGAGPPIVEQPVVPATPTVDYFQAQLAPYGSWVQVPGYGLCWQPAVDFGWRPYFDQGYWEYTDAGWYWQSGYPWGDIVFHYGRWAYTASGWVWLPGYEYAPAWVVWRHAEADGYVGWAALPPGAVFVNGGWEFNHIRVGVDFDFGLRVNFFTFVGYDYFWEHDFRRFAVPHDRLALIYRHSTIETRYHLDHGRFINDGLARERMAALTHREIKAATLRDLREHEENRNALARRDDLHNFKAGAKPDARRIASERNSPADRNHYSSGGNGRNDAIGGKPTGGKSGDYK